MRSKKGEGGFMMFDKDQISILKEAVDKENAKTQEKLQKRPERKKIFTTGSGAPVNRCYTPVDIADLDYMDDLGMPGEFPYTRGVQPNMYRGQFWTMRMYAGFATAEIGRASCRERV